MIAATTMPDIQDTTAFNAWSETARRDAEELTEARHPQSQLDLRAPSILDDETFLRNAERQAEAEAEYEVLVHESTVNPQGVL